MKTTKDVIEAAIKVRETEIERLLSCEPEMSWDEEMVRCAISDADAQITELKQSLQIIYDNYGNGKKLY